MLQQKDPRTLSSAQSDLYWSWNWGIDMFKTTTGAAQWETYNKWSLPNVLPLVKGFTAFLRSPETMTLVSQVPVFSKMCTCSILLLLRAWYQGRFGQCSRVRATSHPPPHTLPTPSPRREICTSVLTHYNVYYGITQTPVRRVELGDWKNGLFCKKVCYWLRPSKVLCGAPILTHFGTKFVLELVDCFWNSCQRCLHLKVVLYIFVNEFKHS